MYSGHSQSKTYVGGKSGLASGARYFNTSIEIIIASLTIILNNGVVGLDTGHVVRVSG